MQTTFVLFDEENARAWASRAPNPIHYGFRAMSTQNKIGVKLALFPEFSEFWALVRCSNHFPNFLNLLHAAFVILHIRREQRVGFLGKYTNRAQNPINCGFWAISAGKWIREIELGTHNFTSLKLDRFESVPSQVQPSTLCVGHKPTKMWVWGQYLCRI